jgi:phosphoglycolate phosphatase
MIPYQHAVFDLDGTLIDSLPGIEWSAAEALVSCGEHPLQRSLRPLLGPPIRSILAQATGVADPCRLDDFERAFRSSYDSEGWRQTVCFAGVVESLAQLASQGITLWVATNKNGLATKNILRELELDGFFREVVCRDSRQPAYSSKREMLSALLDRQGLQRNTCLMVGDTQEDAAAAAGAGIDCAIVAHGYGEEMPVCGCRWIDGWGELLSLFNCSLELPGCERVLVNSNDRS